MYRKYILEKNWSKTTIPALGSGQTENDTPILGCRHQLDDQNRNPNMNNRDHLVGRPTSTVVLITPSSWFKLLPVVFVFLLVYYLRKHLSFWKSE